MLHANPFRPRLSPYHASCLPPVYTACPFVCNQIPNTIRSFQLSGFTLAGISTRILSISFPPDAVRFYMNECTYMGFIRIRALLCVCACVFTALRQRTDCAACDPRLSQSIRKFKLLSSNSLPEWVTTMQRKCQTCECTNKQTNNDFNGRRHSKNGTLSSIVTILFRRLDCI